MWIFRGATCTDLTSKVGMGHRDAFWESLVERGNTDRVRLLGPDPVHLRLRIASLRRSTLGSIIQRMLSSLSALKIASRVRGTRPEPKPT